MTDSPVPNGGSVTEFAPGKIWWIRPDLDDLVGMDDPGVWQVDPACSPRIGRFALSERILLQQRVLNFMWRRRLSARDGWRCPA